MHTATKSGLAGNRYIHVYYTMSGLINSQFPSLARLHTCTCVFYFIIMLVLESHCIKITNKLLLRIQSIHILDLKPKSSGNDGIHYFTNHFEEEKVRLQNCLLTDLKVDGDGGWTVVSWSLKYKQNNVMTLW